MKRFKNKWKYILPGIMMLVATPHVALGAACSLSSGQGEGLGRFLLFPACIINEYLIPLAISLEVVLFIYGIVRYIANANNEAERKQGRSFILWGLLALFITLSFWAIIGIFQNTLQIG